MFITISFPAVFLMAVLTAVSCSVDILWDAAILLVLGLLEHNVEHQVKIIVSLKTLCLVGIHNCSNTWYWLVSLTYCFLTNCIPASLKLASLDKAVSLRRSCSILHYQAAYSNVYGRIPNITQHIVIITSIWFPYKS